MVLRASGTTGPRMDRDIAEFQRFPDDYEFFGARNRIARWIGNAVPVSFAEALGRAALAAVA